MTEKKNVTVDVDGVLAAYTTWKGELHIGDPIEGAVEFTKRLAEKYRVVIHTTRMNYTLNRELTPPAARRQLQEWLDKHGFVWDHIFTGPGKPIAIAYIDDRGVSCRPQDRQDPWDEYESVLNYLEMGILQ